MHSEAVFRHANGTALSSFTIPVAIDELSAEFGALTGLAVPAPHQVRSDIRAAEERSD